MPISKTQIYLSDKMHPNKFLITYFSYQRTVVPMQSSQARWMGVTPQKLKL
jgi:hypothetical protein